MKTKVFIFKKHCFLGNQNKPWLSGLCSTFCKATPSGMSASIVFGVLMSLALRSLEVEPKQTSQTASFAPSWGQSSYTYCFIVFLKFLSSFSFFSFPHQTKTLVACPRPLSGHRRRAGAETRAAGGRAEGLGPGGDV